jgi:glycosyltransferase involved in cell wall biosynthesis
MVQRSLSPPGGGNAVAAWMVHALAGAGELATVTLSNWEPAQTNAFYGTDIPATITRHLTPWPWSQLASLPPDRGRHLMMSAVLRQARRLEPTYDLPITADNFGYFAKPGIQYLHYPVPPEGLSAGLIMRSYFRLGDRLAGVPRSQARRNLTLANSSWTAAGLEHRYGVRARVLHPPVIDPGEGLPWSARRNAFLSIGRFHGSKRFEVVMSIVRRVRAQTLPGARLILVGSDVDADYTRRLERFAARDRDWIEFREDLPRAELNRLIGECRYGLQAMEDEHFGMATAELARGGCVVFPHHSGGSPEVVNAERALLWTTEDEAVAQIGALVHDQVMIDAVRHRLRAHARTFAPDRFVSGLRAIVNDWASGQLAEFRIAQ